MQTGPGPIVPSLAPRAPALGRFRHDENDQHEIDLNADQNELGEKLALILDSLATDTPKQFNKIIRCIKELNLSNQSVDAQNKSERIINKLLRELGQTVFCDTQKSAQITINIQKFIVLVQKKQNERQINVIFDHRTVTDTKRLYQTSPLVFSLELLLKVFNKHRMLHRKKYQATQAALVAFRDKYTLTFSENVFRYAIALNAGMGSGSVIYGIATAFLLSFPVVAISGGLSLVALGLISTYFLRSYTDEDEDLETELFNHELDLNLLAVEEGMLRRKCYELITKIRTNAQKFTSLNDYTFRFKELLANADPSESNELLKLDKIIDAIIADYPQSTSTIATVNANHVSKYNSIFTRVFHSKHWGPILNFFGSTGTLFGVTKAVLALAGVTAIAGSPILLVGVIAAAAISYSIIFALKHWQFNQKSSQRKDHLKDYKTQHMDTLKISLDCLKRFEIDLKTENSKIKAFISKQTLTEVDPHIAAELTEELATTNIASTTRSPVSANSSPSSIGMFSRSNSPDHPVQNEKDVSAIRRPTAA